jgi:DNA-binding HxlR family transcriptional regulator
MKRSDNKSDCPVNISLETFGDSWSLLIVRDIIFWGKRSYKDFLESPEHISTNILANRLRQLEQKGVLHKIQSNDGRSEYKLTGAGLDLIPIIIEMSAWGMRHTSHGALYKKFIETLYADRERTLRTVREGVQEGRSIFGAYSIEFKSFLAQTDENKVHGNSYFLRNHP